MSREKFPVTPAIRFLRAQNVAFESHLYPYVERGGTRASSIALGVDEHHVIKTLVFEDEAQQPLGVLMHGDKAVSAKELGRKIGARKIQSADPKSAEKHTGYAVGGTSPFGIRTPMKIYVEETILDLDWVFVNGGKRGFLVRIDPQVFLDPLGAIAVQVATSLSR